MQNYNDENAAQSLIFKFFFVLFYFLISKQYYETEKVQNDAITKAITLIKCKFMSAVNGKISSAEI